MSKTGDDTGQQCAKGNNSTDAAGPDAKEANAVVLDVVNIYVNGSNASGH